MRSGVDDLLLSGKLLGDIMIGLLGDLSGEKRGDEQTTAIVSRVGYGRILVFCDQELFVAKELELASGRREKTI